MKPCWSNRIPLLILSLIVVATVATYAGLPWNGFVMYDDTEYITENARVGGGITLSTVAWAFTSSYQGNWHPLTWLSHMLDVQMFGLNPAGHHLISLLIHVTNAVLLFLLFQKITGKPWRSGMLALFFALHPLHVESVAWA